MRNIEIKAKVRNLNQLIENIKILCKNDGTIINQHDTFYKTDKGRLKLRKYEDNSSELIYYERPDQEGPKLCNYEKCSLNADCTPDLKKVLAKALGETVVVKKKRQLYMVGQTRVHVDSVENLGDFMELEVVLNDAQTTEEGEEIAYSIMNKIGVSKDDLISGAYADLLK